MKLNNFTKAVLIVLVILCIYEIMLLSIAFFGADEIKCNLLWCEFKTTRRTIQENTRCFENGVETNCSKFNAFDFCNEFFYKTNYTNLQICYELANTEDLKKVK